MTENEDANAILADVLSRLLNADASYAERINDTLALLNDVRRVNGADPQAVPTENAYDVAYALYGEHDTLGVEGTDPRRECFEAGWAAAIARLPVPVEEDKPRKFTPEQRAELIDFAQSAIQSVWDDVGATTAEVLAGNVVSAQEFAWLSMHFPVAVPVEAE